ncbi:hypothetical protein D3C86_948490 [compost metagenome]
MLKKNALNAASVRKLPATPISAEPATMAPMRRRVTDRPCPSAAAGFSPTMRIARPTGVRFSTHASMGTAASAIRVMGVCPASTGPMTGMPSRNFISAKGVMVGGVLTLGNVTR